MDIDGVTFGAPACSPVWVQKPLIKINMVLSFLPSLWPSKDPRMGRSTKEIIWKQCSGTNEPAGLLSFRNPRDAQSIFSEASSPLRSLCHRTFSSCHFFPEPIILQEQAWFISGPRKQVILFLSPSKPEHIPPSLWGPSGKAAIYKPGGGVLGKLLIPPSRSWTPVFQIVRTRFSSLHLPLSAAHTDSGATVSWDSEIPEIINVSFSSAGNLFQKV